MFLSLLQSFYRFFNIILFLFVSVAVTFLAVIFYFARDLPDYKQLANYTPPLVTRFYSSDGIILAEHAIENRIFVSIDKIPRLLVNAFLAAEDKNFYNHPGLDLTSITRAAVKNLINIGSHKSLIGGSTITQQVVKNFLLTNERSYSRKIKEAILSFRINQAYSKDKILELYLNQIYLGNRSYGVTYAALNYFNKPLEALSLEEIAFLAALPKAPSNYDPKRFYSKAIARRNWVIERMKEENFVTETQAKEASYKEIILKNKEETHKFNAEHFSESVRREIANIYGDTNLYESGFNVYTTLDTKLQKIAEKSFRDGLVLYDKKQGYKGAILHLQNPDDWISQIKKTNEYKSISPWFAAIVKEISSDKLSIEIENGKKTSLALSDCLWAKANLKHFKEIFKTGDIILVEEVDKKKYTLRQIPKVNGGLVVIEPVSGKILAMVGGFNLTSEFNRATQAKRQPGSAFKPFVYLAALEHGLTPNSIILDGPIELYQGPNLPMWKPKNYSNDYLGPTTLRKGLEKSRNTMTVRLGVEVGINKLTEITKRFAISENPPRNFSIVLGATETTLLNLTNAYAMIVNGGKKVLPTQIEYIQDSNGTVIYRNNSRKCVGCVVDDDSDLYASIPATIEEQKTQIIDEATSYQMISMLEGVVERGTATLARQLGANIGGKTGTTNNSNDVWFVGFSKNLVFGTYIGYDSPKSLGKRETGATTALPIFVDFMNDALKIRPNSNFSVPENINIIKIDPNTGELKEDEHDAIYEFLKKEESQPTIDIFEELID